MISNWLKSNRKKVLVHSLILSGFLLYLLFLAEPLFDRFEAIPGESRLHKFLSPRETVNIQGGLEKFDVSTHVIEAQGWAFIDGQDSVDSKIYIALKSHGSIYIFDTDPMERPDVAAHKKLNQNLNWSGFNAIIPTRKIKSGKYIIGLYITKEDIQALQYFDKAIIKSKEDVKLMVRMSKQQEISLPEESNDIKFNIDSCREVINEEREFKEIRGWAFVNGQDTEGSKIYLVLKSDENIYIFDTIGQARPGVTVHFAELGLNLNHSGFIARIPKEDIKRGTYRLGIYIDKEPLKALHYTENVIELK